MVLLGACHTAPVPAKRAPRSARPAPVRAEPTPHRAAATPPKAVAAPPTAAFRELAEKIQALIVATLEHRTPPATLPLAKARYGGRRIESSDPLPPTAGLTSLVFSIDMEFFFEPSGKALRVVFVLTPTGIKVAHLRVPSFLGSRPHPLPSWLAVGSDLGTFIHQTVGAGDVRSVLVGESERRLVGDDDHFDEVWRKLAPTEADIRKAEQLLANSGPPTGYFVYQFGWLARTAAGDLYGFEVILDHLGPDDPLAIDTEPLVRTKKLGPRSP